MSLNFEMNQYSDKRKQIFFDIKNSDSIYKEVLQNFFENYKNKTNYKDRILTTILGLSSLEKNIDEISKIDNEKIRNSEILKRTSLTAEPGFSEGKNSKEVANMLRDRVNLFAKTYLQDKKEGSLERFYKEAFKSAPCFNGRMEQISLYRAKYQENIPEEALLDATQLDFEAYKLTEAMYNFSMVTPPTQDEFVNYLKDLENYESQYQPLIESPKFIKLYNRAKELF